MKVAERWAEVDTSWHRRARCFVCRRGFVCNNYADRKARVRRIEGAVICPWCGHNPSIETIVKAMLAMSPKKLKKHMAIKRVNYG